VTARAPAPSYPPGAADARAGSRQARYVIKERLASGGMGAVYRVFDKVTGEERALKRVRSDAAAERFLLEAFEREYHVLAMLDHPRIIRVFDYDVDDEGPYYTMELLDGKDMRKASPLSYRAACLCLRDVATSLALLHARRLVHRDLSPGNVRMTLDGHCKVFDFGALATFGHADVIVGTPPVVPPEAFGRAPLDQRTDLYSLGALAYWMLTGRHAYAARNLAELPVLWRAPPPAPSSFFSEIPPELDALVLALLSTDPLARPASAAEVIARLTVIGELPSEHTTETKRLALSFLSNPRFVGRGGVLEALRALTEAAVRGQGGAVCIDAVAGMGRSRVLEEIGVYAQLAGAAVVRVDASMYRDTQGTGRALALRLIDVLPDLALQGAPRFRTALLALGPQLQMRISGLPSEPGAERAQIDASTGHPSLEGWFADISLDKPLVIQVDNVEYADDAGLGLLAALAMVAREHRMVVMTTLCTSRERDPAMGLATLQERSTRIELAGLTSAEVFELARSIFGDAPNVERFADWLYQRTAGSPLHVLEISRQLFAKDIIRYTAGVWTLPDDEPDTELPAALGDALSARVALLSEPARILAECLSLQRQLPTFELCGLLSSHSDERGVLSLLDELAQKDVLYPERDGYRFSSVALQEALLAAMDEVRLEQNHRRLGDAFTKLAGEDRPRLRIEAGWHLIQGGEELRGADLIAGVTHDAVTARELLANLHRIGRPLEAALRVFGKYRRPLRDRVPLLAALAQAGYYEDRSWGERYGDEALYVLEQISGLDTARHLRRICGGLLALGFGILFAWIRFQLAPREERNYPFGKVFVHLLSVVTTLAGVAALSLDAERIERVAAVLEPFSALPARATPAGVYHFCRGLKEIARESEAVAWKTFDVLLARFKNPRFYRTLPADARRLYIAGIQFARGSIAIYRADGRDALDCADALDATGLKLYAMIASQLRWLYYAVRGEFTRAKVHRERVELQAAHLGSVWQVETWEAASLLVIYPQLADIVGSTRLAHRLELLSETVPSMKRYARFANMALALSRREDAHAPKWQAARAEYATHVPRSYIGWAGVQGYTAMTHNLMGEHTEAKEVCERALSQVTDEDRDYVMLFLLLDLELAIADAALGRADVALRSLNALIDRYKEYDHALALGLLYECRGHIAWAAGRGEEYEESLAEMERWFLPTKTPVLIAKCKRLRERRGSASREIRPWVNAASSSTTAVDAHAAVTETEPVAETVVHHGRERGSGGGGRRDVN
jgi:tRNA A-37 threonylcarbamoyl transferase component Bud32